MAELSPLPGSHKAAIRGPCSHLEAQLGRGVSVSKLIQVVGRFHFLAALGLMVACFQGQKEIL